MAQIRAAYLKLIKQHHPDATGDETNDAARVLNQAYRTLRRQAGFAGAASDDDATAIDLRDRAASSAASPRPPRRAILFAGLSLTVAAFCYLAYARQPGPAVAPGVVAGNSPPDDQDARRADAVRQAGLNFEWVALQSDASGAKRYSEDCWNNLVQSASDALFDYCLAFDSVARRALGSGDVYFAPAAVIARGRASSAGRLRPHEALAQRIAQIDTMLARNRQPSRVKSRITWFPLPGPPARHGGPPDYSPPPLR